VNKIDLHIHSYYSDDGELSISEILDASRNLKMQVISITDHNCVKGVREAVQYGKQLNIDVIPGIEIDCTFQATDLHLLGYHINIDLKEYHQLEQDIYQQEMAAFSQRIDKLQNLGVMVDADTVLQKANGKIASGELIGEVALEQEQNRGNSLLKPYLKGGKRSDMPFLNFYRDFFAQGKAAHVSLRYPSLREAVDLVIKSNGIPVIAHPGDNLREDPTMIDAIIKEGVMGIEVFSNYHTAAQVDYFLQKAVENKLIISCGSDFHGKNKPGIGIGMCHCTLDETHLIEALRSARPIQ
jgi:3',5'-nucleoside bisphosphate phosphatase